MALVMANETAKAQAESLAFSHGTCGVWESLLAEGWSVQVHLDWGHSS